jgi:hypothetical protein
MNDVLTVVLEDGPAGLKHVEGNKLVCVKCIYNVYCVGL